ncbi:hypothetical protein Agub_g8954, partial [Astrephomene gubernaculifera]
ADVLSLARHHGSATSSSYCRPAAAAPWADTASLSGPFAAAAPMAAAAAAAFQLRPQLITAGSSACSGSYHNGHKSAAGWSEPPPEEQRRGALLSQHEVSLRNSLSDALRPDPCFTPPRRPSNNPAASPAAAGPVAEGVVGRGGLLPDDEDVTALSGTSAALAATLEYDAAVLSGAPDGTAAAAAAATATAEDVRLGRYGGGNSASDGVVIVPKRRPPPLATVEFPDVSSDRSSSTPDRLSAVTGATAAPPPPLTLHTLIAHGLRRSEPSVTSSLDPAAAAAGSSFSSGTRGESFTAYTTFLPTPPPPLPPRPPLAAGHSALPPPHPRQPSPLRHSSSNTDTGAVHPQGRMSADNASAPLSYNTAVAAAGSSLLPFAHEHRTVSASGHAAPPSSSSSSAAVAKLPTSASGAAVVAHRKLSGPCSSTGTAAASASASPSIRSPRPLALTPLALPTDRERDESLAAERAAAEERRRIRVEGPVGGTYRTRVCSIRIGTFRFKGSPEDLPMAHIVLENLVGRRFPAEAPKGKGVKVADSAGLLEECDVLLPDLASRLRERFLLGAPSRLNSPPDATSGGGNSAGGSNGGGFGSPSPNGRQ